MQWSVGGRALRAARRVSRPRGWWPPSALWRWPPVAPTTGRARRPRQPRGATVAFESIDGPPPGQFRKLVQALNNEAQTRRLAVMSRESPSAYRVRGYLAAKVAKRETTISWVWDVFDRDDHRALRIAGEETAKGRHRDAWSAADDAMLRRIAGSSMDQLAAFLTSPEVAPSTPDTEPRMALAGAQDSRRKRPVSSAFSSRMPTRARSTPPRPRRPPLPARSRCRRAGHLRTRLYRPGKR